MTSCRKRGASHCWRRRSLPGTRPPAAEPRPGRRASLGGPRSPEPGDRPVSSLAIPLSLLALWVGSFLLSGARLVSPASTDQTHLCCRPRRRDNQERLQGAAMALGHGLRWEEALQAVCRQRSQGCRGQAETRGLGLPLTLAWLRLCPIPPPPPTRVHPPPSNMALSSSENPLQPPRKGEGRTGPRWPPCLPSFLLRPQGHEA